MPTSHKEIGLGDRHGVHNYEYADAAARTGATGFVAGDVGKWAKQLDTGVFYELTDDSPVTWAQRTGAGSVSSASDTVAGIVELATTAETTTGTDATRAVTPDGLHDMTSIAGAAWVLDEDAMGSDSATKLPTQQSVKAYVDAQVGGGSTFEIPASNIVKVVKIPGSSTTFTGVGLPNGATTAGSPTAADDADGPLMKIATSGTINSGNSMLDQFGNQNYARRDWETEFLAHIKTDSDVSSIRFNIGLTDTTLTTRTGNHHCAAFSYDTAVDGTAFWRTITEGNAAATTTTTTTVAVAADTVYSFRIKLGASTVLFYIDGVLVATHSTNLPTGSTGMGYTIRVDTLVAAIRGIKFSRVEFAQKG